MDRRGIRSRPRSRLTWQRWWERRSLAGRIAPGTLGVVYALVLHHQSALQRAHLGVIGALVLLAYAGPPLQGIFEFVLPLGLVALIYDSMGIYRERLRGEVHVTEPYHWDLSHFGIPGPSGSLLTPNEYWQLHAHPWLDLYTGFFYIGFLALFVGTVAYWRFLHPRVRGREETRLLTWAFLWTNVLGYVTYFLYPAAPPWYVAEYGFGPIRSGVRPSAAAGLRFDSLLGVNWFEAFYGRSQDVFGAIPSLHVSYPLIIVFFAFRLGVSRGWALLFYASMCFGAVYLNHHYVLDLLLGSVYALLVCLILTFRLAWKDRSRGRGQGPDLTLKLSR